MGAEAVAVIFAHLALPREHRAKLYSTNPIERLNNEIKRPTDVVEWAIPARSLHDV
jgi:transposase-like protein